MWRGGYVFSPWVVLAQMAAVQAAFYGSLGVALFLLAGERERKRAEEERDAKRAQKTAMARAARENRKTRTPPLYSLSHPTFPPAPFAFIQSPSPAAPSR